MAATITLRADRFDSILSERGASTNVAAAEILGIDNGTISRVRRGKSEPGPRFIAQTLLNLAVTFDEVFAIEEAA